MTNFNVTSDEHVSLISDKPSTQKSNAKKLKGKKPCKSLAKNERKNLSAPKGKNAKIKKEKCNTRCWWAQCSYRYVLVLQGG